MLRQHRIHCLPPFFTLLFSISFIGFPTQAQSIKEEKSITMLRTAYQTIFSHLHRPDITPGAVIASPSMDQPNYFYHWVRDAGLTMMELLALYQLPLPPERHSLLESYIQAWINFEIQNQNTALKTSNLGEPIFTVMGDIYPHSWGRPQNDGPAVRSIAMTLFAFELIKQNRLTEAQRLYRSELPANSPIKRDLEYVSTHWNKPNFDLWEEVKGEHFFTKMAQRTALMLGAELARNLNDSSASSFYLYQAKELESSLRKHINSLRNIIVPTLNPIGGWKGKDTELDSATILAILYFSMGDGLFDLHDSFTLQTAANLESAFSQLYTINIKTRDYAAMSPGIGRYPEDVYNGAGFSEGNPWFITTNAFAEYYCRLANNHPRGPYAAQFRAKAMGFINRTLLHSDSRGQMSEQFNRYNGYMQGARDLTWSYVSYLRAYRSCHQSESQYKQVINHIFSSIKHEK